MIEFQAPTHSKASITEWLVEWIAKELALPTAEIETDKSLLNYSLSSVTAMMLVGDLEEWLGLTLPPTLVWDYPSIDAIADYLIEQLGNPVTGIPTSNGSSAFCSRVGRARQRSHADGSARRHVRSGGDRPPQPIDR